MSTKNCKYVIKYTTTHNNSSLKKHAHVQNNKTNLNSLQVANYGIGGHYTCHQDPAFVYAEPTDPPVLNTDRDPTAEGEPYVTGDRMSTFMIYLSEVR